MSNESSHQPTAAELQETIDELSAYRSRLYQDVVGLGQKLRLSQKKIEATISEHPELQRIDAILAQLIQQKEATTP